MPKQVSQSPCQKVMAKSCLGLGQVPKTNRGTQQEIFLGRGDFMKFGHFNKHLVKNTRKEGPTGKNFAFFSLDTLKTTFRMEKITQSWIQSGPFFQNQGTFLDFEKKGKRDFPTSSLAPALLVAYL